MTESARASFESKPARKPALVPQVITDPLKEDVVSALMNQGMKRIQAEAATSGRDQQGFEQGL